MARITLADLTAEPTTVELFDGTYRVLAITRSTQKKLDVAEKKLSESESEDSDELVALLIGVIAEIVEPVESAPPIKKTLLDAWKADKVGLGQLRGLYESVQEAALARPTSRRRS